MSPVCFVTEVLSMLRSSTPFARMPLPNLPLCVCADLRCASPFPLRPAPLQGWGYPSACSCYPPPSPGGVRHLVEMPTTKTKTRSNDHDDQKANRRISDSRPVQHSRVHHQSTPHL